MVYRNRLPEAVFSLQRPEDESRVDRDGKILLINPV
jgi:hypothetical protein